MAKTVLSKPIFSKKNGNLIMKFESPISIDNGYTNAFQGIKKSEMELFIHEGEQSGCIEWVVEETEFVEHIGVWFDKKKLTDYDGVFELPKQAVLLLRTAGFIVPKDFLQ